MRLSGSHTFLEVTYSYVSQATHAFLGMLPLCFKKCLEVTNYLVPLYLVLSGLNVHNWIRDKYINVGQVIFSGSDCF